MGELVIPGSELKELNTTDMKNDTTDRISYFPEPIMHHILSFLPYKDVACSSVLSKTWWQVWATFPILDFDETLFGVNPECKYLDFVDECKKFMNFVDDSLLRFLEQKTCLQRFRLLMTLYHNNLAYRIDHWIDLARAYNVKELDLHFLPGPFRKVPYRLPQTIYAAKSLNVMTLKYCVLNPPLCKLAALKELSLANVYADEKIIQNLVESCPSIEKFVLKWCEWEGSLQLLGFTKLQKVKVQDCSYERIHIEAPNLQSFHFLGCSRACNPRVNLCTFDPFPKMQWRECRALGLRKFPCKIDLMACKNLIVLKLKYAVIDDQWAQALLSNFPLLKTLVLRDCETSVPVTISSSQLQRLELSLDDPRLDSMIDAPNLCSFKYAGDINPSLHSMDTSSLLTAELKLYRYGLTTYRYSKLREYLGKFSHVKVVNLHIVSRMISFYPEEFEKIRIPPVCDIEHMKLKISLTTKWTPKSALPIPINYEALVDGLLWASHPGTLSVELGCSSNIEFLKVLCKKLMNRWTKQSCCTSAHFQCWHHHLKDVKIKRFAGTRGSETLHYRALLELLPTLPPDQMITFEFKW